MTNGSSRSCTLPARSFYGTWATSFAAPCVRPAKASRAAVLKAKRARDRSRHPLRCFPTQQQAFEFADRSVSGGALQVWSYEVDCNGRRRYIAASVPAMWRWYRRIIRRGLDAPIHLYEVIRSERACRAYFDIEFKKDCEERRAMDGEAMVTEVVYAAGRVLGEWGCEAVMELVQEVVDLDSTTETKFSRHLIFPRIVFENNAVAGAFAAACHRELPHIAQQIGLIDLAVYTKNRCFRVVGSSKFARDARLLPKHHGVVAPDSPNRHISLSESLFLRSLVCHVGSDVPIVRCPEAAMQTISGFSRPIFVRGPGDTAIHEGDARSEVRTARCGPPEFRGVDEYILSLIEPHGGGIYTVSYFAASATLSYTIKGRYRYCSRIGRHHRSNNVILVVSLNTRQVYQRCFDPDCRSYRSSPWPLPGSAYPQGLDAKSDEDTELDVIMNRLMDEMERSAGPAEMSGDVV